MLNPIRTAGGGGKVLSGTFEGVLRNIETVQGKKYQSEELEDKLRFTFEIASEGTSVNTRCTPKLGDKSTLTKLLRQMGGSNDVVSTSDKAWSFLMAQIGRKFFLSVAPNDKGTYTNIVSLMPVPGQTTPTPLADPEEEVDF